LRPHPTRPRLALQCSNVTCAHMSRTSLRRPPNLRQEQTPGAPACRMSASPGFPDTPDAHPCMILAKGGDRASSSITDHPHSAVATALRETERRKPPPMVAVSQATHLAGQAGYPRSCCRSGLTSLALSSLLLPSSQAASTGRAVLNTGDTSEARKQQSLKSCRQEQQSGILTADTLRSHTGQDVLIPRSPSGQKKDLSISICLCRLSEAIPNGVLQAYFRRPLKVLKPDKKVRSCYT